VTPEQIQQLLDALQAQGGAVGDLRDQLQGLTDAQLELARVQNDVAEGARNRANQAIQQEIEFRRRALTVLDVQQDAIEREMQAMSDKAEKLQAEIELQDIFIQRLELAAKAEGANTEEIQRNIEAFKKRKKELEKQKKAQLELKKSTDSLSKSLSSMLSGTAPDIDSILNPDKIMSSIKDFRKLSKSAGGAGAALKQLGMKAAAGAALALAVNIVKLAKDLGDGEAAFKRATNASDAFARTITTTYQEGRKFAATSEDMFAAATSLTRGFTDFTFQSKEAKKSITIQTAALNKMGLSNEAVANSLQLMTKSFNMTGKDGVKQLTNLEKFSTNLGVPLEKLGSDFQAAGGDLAKLGDNGMEAFKGLAKTMKVTGLEMSKILNLTRQFDTFEGAARQAGKLNAALGGNFVNAMDLMMETDPSARFEQIRDAILDTGLSFDEMGYQQRNFYRDALNLGSVSELAAVLSGDMESVTGETMKSSQQLKELRDRARETASFQEKLNAVFAQLAPILTPIIDGFSGILKFVSDNITVFKILSGVLIGLVGGPLGAVIGGIAMLMSSIETGNDEVSLLGSYFQGLIAPFQFLYELIEPLITKIREFFGAMSPETIEKIGNAFKIIGAIVGGVLMVKLALVLVPLIKMGFIFSKLVAGASAIIAKLKAVGAAMLTLKGGAMAIGGAIAGVSAAFGGLGDKLFKEKMNPKNMLIGLGEMSAGFDSIGASAKSIEPELAKATKTAGKLGDNLFGRDGDALTVSPAVQQTGEIAESIAANAGKASVENATTKVTATAAAVGGALDERRFTENNTTINNGMGATSEINNSIRIEMDGKVMKEFVLKTTGEQASKAMRGYSG